LQKHHIEAKTYDQAYFRSNQGQTSFKIYQVNSGFSKTKKQFG